MIPFCHGNHLPIAVFLNRTFVACPSTAPTIGFNYKKPHIRLPLYMYLSAYIENYRILRPWGLKLSLLRKSSTVSISTSTQGFTLRTLGPRDTVLLLISCTLIGLLYRFRSILCTVVVATLLNHISTYLGESSWSKSS